MVEKIKRMFRRRLTRLAYDYIEARYPDGVKDKRIYLSIAIIKDKDDNDINIQFNNEYNEHVGSAADIEFPLDEFWHIKPRR